MFLVTVGRSCLMQPGRVTLIPPVPGSVSDPGVVLEQFRILGEIFFPGHPAVALAQQAEEERPTPIDLVQADADDLALPGLLFRHAPAQVYFPPNDAALLAELPQLWENPLDQDLPLFVHVA